MLRFACFVAVFAVFVACAPAAASAGPSGASRTNTPAGDGSSYVVVYKDSLRRRSGFAPTRETGRLEKLHGFHSRLSYHRALQGFSARLTPEQAAALREDPKVALVTPDRVVHAAGRVPLQAGETVPSGAARIGALTGEGAHDASTVGVAVLDTGIKLGHSDLNAYPGKNCIASRPPEDDNGHGTYTAGVIGARNNGLGVVGIAPGTRIYAVKVLRSDGSGLGSELICGIDWVTANATALGIKVANLSLAGVGPSSTCATDALHLAICNATARGVTFTVAAGNSGADLGGYTPASYPEVLTVTAISDSDGSAGGLGGAPRCLGGEADDYKASFSNYATSAVDVNHVVAAPGVCIASTALSGLQTTDSGTSAAAPHVAGVAALCFGEGNAPGPCADMTPAEVVQQIRADASANATPDNGFTGDPNHSLGGYFGFLVSGVDPSVRRIPLRAIERTASAPTQASPVPPSPSSATTDAVVQIRVRVPRVQDLKHLHVIARMAEAGTISARATVRIRRTGGARRRAARTITLRSSVRKVIPNRRMELRLKVGRTDLRALKRALGRRRSLSANVEVLARDRVGNSVLKHRTVRLRR